MGSDWEILSQNIQSVSKVWSVTNALYQMGTAIFNFFNENSEGPYQEIINALEEVEQNLILNAEYVAEKTQREQYISDGRNMAHDALRQANIWSKLLPEERANQIETLNQSIFESGQAVTKFYLNVDGNPLDPDRISLSESALLYFAMTARISVLNLAVQADTGYLHTARIEGENFLNFLNNAGFLTYLEDQARNYGIYVKPISHVEIIHEGPSIIKLKVTDQWDVYEFGKKVLHVYGEDRQQEALDECDYRRGRFHPVADMKNSADMWAHLGTATDGP